MEITKSMKIKVAVSEENTKKILDLIEEEFSAIGTCDMDDNKLTISKLNAGLANFYKSSSTVTLKENKDGQSYQISVNSSVKLSIVFWISCVISLLLFFPLIIADVGIVFYNNSEINKKFDGALNKIKSELD